MKYIKCFEDFNWNEYGDKREFLDIIRECIKEAGELKDKIEKVSWSGRNSFSGAYISQKMREKGFNPGLANTIWNRVNYLKGRIGPNMGGEFVNVKRNIFQKLMGKSPIGVRGDTSVIGNLMDLVGDDSIRKELKDDRIKEIAKEIWYVHPNNPKNKTNESSKYGIGYDDDGNFIGFKDPEYVKAVEEQERRSLQFVDRMEDYKEEIKNLKDETIKIKESVIKKLTSADYKPDENKVKGVAEAFDRILIQIGPGRVTKEDRGFLSRFKKKKEDTTKDYSILDLADMFINKEDIKIWF